VAEGSDGWAATSPRPDHLGAFPFSSETRSVPIAEDRRRTERLNFTVYKEDAARIRERAALVVHDGEEPNAPLAVRLAVNHELERRARGRKKV
jgi:hypothetical protein